MTGALNREPDRARARRTWLLCLIAIFLIFPQTDGVAWAFWTADSDPGGSGASAATSVNQGSTPTASAIAAAVTVSWAATTLGSGQAVSGYLVKRYDALSPFALPTTLSSCAGRIATTSCVENSVPTGSWQYTVTPTFATNWLGAESLKSSSVMVDVTAPTNGITVSNVTGGAHKISDNIFYRGVASGSFTLTNSVADAGSGPASSATASLTGTTTGWTHTPSTVTTPSGGPYVSNTFSWSSSTAVAVGEIVTGRDSAGNTTNTSLSFVDDSATPGAGTVSYSDGIQSGLSVSVTFTTGTDAGSGIGTRLLQRASANLTGTTCGSFGTFSTITGGTNPTSPLVDSVSKGCFQYRYVVSDNVGNQDTATSANVAKVDSNYSSAVTGTTGLVGYWRLGDSSGATIADSFGTNPGTYVNTPTLGGTGAISGSSNTAASFNGSNQYGTVARQISDNFSIEFWFKSTQSAGSNCSQWYHGNGLVDAEVGGVTNDFGVSLCAGRVVAGVGGPFDRSIASASGYNNGAWHHVVFTRTRSSGALSLYLDGVLAGSATGSTNSLTTAPNINFGRLQTAIQYFAGTLDEIAVYNTALSQATVTNHYGWGTGFLPPVVTATGATLAYTENASQLVDSGVTATDADSVNLTSATVTMTTNYVNGQDTLAFTDQFGITGTWTPGTGVLALTGSATVAHYQSALRSITYTNSSDDPTTTTRTVTFVANDGTSGGNTASRTITLTAVNDAPVNSVPGSQATDSNTAVVFSTGNGNLISISDADAGAGIVEVQLVSTLGRSTLSGTTGLSFSVGDGTADTTMTFTGTTTDTNTALAGLSFTPTSVGAGSLQIVTSDHGNTGTGGTLADDDTIAIGLGDLGLFTDTTDIGSGSAGPTSSSYMSGVYTEVGNGADIWNGSDQFHYRYRSWTGDGTIIARVTALGNSQISAKAAVMFRETTDTGSNHTLMSVRPTAANSAEWMYRNTTGGSTAVVDTGGLTPTLWLKLVRSGNTFTGFTAPDSGGSAGTWTQRGTQSITMGNTILVGLSTLSHSASLTTTATYDNVSLSAPPALTASGSSRAYTENTTTVLDSGITASDGYSPLLTSATVTMTTNYVNGQDTLAFTNQNGITGTWTDGTGVLALTGSATIASYQSALRSITYTNTSDDPSTATRTVTFTSNDGVLDSNTASRTITLTAVNDAPVNSVPGSQATDSNTAIVFSTGNGNLISINDADAGSVQVQLVSTLGKSTLSGTTGLSFSVGDGTADTTMTFTGTTTDANTALAGLSFTPDSVGAGSLQIVTSDQGNTGTGGTLTDNDTIAIVVDSHYASTIGATAGLISYWRLGEGWYWAGIDDIAINDNDGNYFNYLNVGMSGAIAGDPDTAVRFDGDMEQAFGRVNRQISDDFSIEFWFSSNQWYSSDSACQYWWQGAGLVDSKIGSYPANDFGVSLCDGRVIAGSGNPDTSIVSPSMYNDGSWHHVIFTRTRNTGEMQLYVDGANAGSATGNTDSLTGAADIYFGALANDTGYFEGYLDEVAIYDTALSGATVTDHHAAAQ